jgi:predicted phage terminase large subunit-like protein
MNAAVKPELTALLNLDAIHLELANRARTSLRAWSLLIAPHEPPARHHQLLINALEAVDSGKIKRLMFFMPPGHAKSKYGSERFPAWWVGRHPTEPMLAASNVKDLAEVFGRRVRNIVGGEEFLATFGFGLDPSSTSATRWGTVHGGEYYGTGVGGAITGRRAGGGLIDDPLKGHEEADSKLAREKLWEWYRTEFRTRLKPNAWIVLIQTRWHEDDLAGRILPDAYAGETGWVKARDGEMWYVVCCAALCEKAEGDPLNRKLGEALWEEYIGATSLRQEEITQGRRNWDALFQQRPKALQGALFKADRIEIVDRLPPGIRWCRGWDLAATAESEGGNPDWTAGVKMGVDQNGRFYVGGVERKRLSPNGVENLIVDTAKMDTAMVKISLPQDPGQAGKAQVTWYAQKLAGFRMFSSPESGDKEIRATPFASQVEAHNVTMLKGDWNQAYLDELRGFPTGSKDDQVDASSRAFMALLERPDGMGVYDYYREMYEDFIGKVHGGPAPGAPHIQQDLNHIVTHTVNGVIVPVVTKQSPPEMPWKA